MAVQKGKKLGFALSLSTEYWSVENFKKNELTECPIDANKDCILKRISELKSSKKLFSTKSETDDALSSCSNFPERPTETELASELAEIEQLKGKLSDKEVHSLRAVLGRNADVFRNTRLI